MPASSYSIATSRLFDLSDSQSRPRSSSSRSRQSPAPTLDKDGMPLRETGGVPFDLLQSLYLGDERRTGSERDSPSDSDGAPDYVSHHARQGSSVSVSTTTSNFTDNAKSFSFHSKGAYPPVLKIKNRKRISVTGGAGFVGSHLVDRLMCLGHDVVVLDNFFSSTKASISHWIGHPNFELVRADVVEPFMIEVDQIYHLACPASPLAYQYNPVKTIKINTIGTMNMLGLAKRIKARFLLASTSEIYGSPLKHPQSETDWGNVNCIGPRACYDEGKRVAEALTYGYHRQDGVDVRVARIFNCFGPRMNTADGRLVSNFCVAALHGRDLEIYGDGSHTRSLIYVQDLVTGLIKLMESDFTEPVNLGSEEEATVKEWAELIRSTVEEMKDEGTIDEFMNSEERERSEEGKESGGAAGGRKVSQIVFKDAVVDDPPRRRPDLTRARKELGWEPKWSVKSGLEETIRWYASEESEL